MCRRACTHACTSSRISSGLGLRIVQVAAAAAAAAVVVIVSDVVVIVVQLSPTLDYKDVRVEVILNQVHGSKIQVNLLFILSYQMTMIPMNYLSLITSCHFHFVSL